MVDVVFVIRFLEAYRNKLVVKKYHHLVSGKWQHLDSQKNSKMT